MLAGVSSDTWSGSNENSSYNETLGVGPMLRTCIVKENIQTHMQQFLVLTTGLHCACTWQKHMTIMCSQCLVHVVVCCSENDSMITGDQRERQPHITVVQRS